MSAFGAGVVASIFAWFVITLGLRPKLRWRKALVARVFARGADPAWRYEARVENARWTRAAVDVHVFARLRIKGPNPVYRRNSWWLAHNVPTTADRAPVLRRRPPRLLRRARKQARKKFRWAKKWIAPGKAFVVVAMIELDHIPESMLRVLPRELASRCRRRQVFLEDLMDQGSEATVRFVATAIDSWGGSWGLFQSRLHRNVTEYLDSRDPDSKSKAIDAKRFFEIVEDEHGVRRYQSP